MSRASLAVGAPPLAAPSLLQTSSVASLLAGFLTAFTVSVVGEMPVGEGILVGVAAWAAASAAAGRSAPVPLLRAPLLWTFMAAQLVALCAYILSDLSWASSAHDMIRGWSRMGFLAVDVAAIAYLFGCSRTNFEVFVLGRCLGESFHALAFGAMFDDMWKFGVGSPLTCAGAWLAGLMGPLAASGAATGLGLVNFAMDYRSLGGLCIATAACVILRTAGPRARPWLAPAALVCAAALLVWLRGGSTASTGRANRSDIERSAMVQAAAEAFAESPLVGHGSWFSQSHVYDDFLVIRHSAAREAGVGGFADANTDPGDVALHSQILVAVAEGGAFGGLFFVVFGIALVWALGDAVFVLPWSRLTPLCVLTLLTALWNLFLSPFSGAHRVYIAEACGLILLIRQERTMLRREGRR